MKSALIILALAATVLAHPQPAVRPRQPDEIRTCVHTRFLREHVCFHCQNVADAEAFALGQANADGSRRFNNYDVFGGRPNPNVVQDQVYVDQRNGQGKQKVHCSFIAQNSINYRYSPKSLLRKPFHEISFETLINYLYSTSIIISYFFPTALCRIDGQTAWRCTPVVGGNRITKFNCRTCRNSPNVSSWSTQNNGHLEYTSDGC